MTWGDPRRRNLVSICPEMIPDFRDTTVGLSGVLKALQKGGLQSGKKTP
jgi:hypothetical protein